MVKWVAAESSFVPDCQNNFSKNIALTKCESDVEIKNKCLLKDLGGQSRLRPQIVTIRRKISG